MAQAEYHETLNVNRDKLLSVITDYESYPQFVEGCKETKAKREPNGTTRVNYHVQMMSQDILYTLDHQENLEGGILEWSLIESNLFKKNIGKWELKSLAEGKTDVRYTIDIEFKVAVPGFILNRLVKGSLPSMVKSFEARANKLTNKL